MHKHLIPGKDSSGVQNGLPRTANCSQLMRLALVLWPSLQSSLGNKLDLAQLARAVCSCFKITRFLIFCVWFELPHSKTWYVMPVLDFRWFRVFLNWMLQVHLGFGWLHSISCQCHLCEQCAGLGQNSPELEWHELCPHPMSRDAEPDCGDSSSQASPFDRGFTCDGRVWCDTAGVPSVWQIWVSLEWQSEACPVLFSCDLQQPCCQQLEGVFSFSVQPHWSCAINSCGRHGGIRCWRSTRSCRKNRADLW